MTSFNNTGLRDKHISSRHGYNLRRDVVGVIIFGGHCTDGFLIDYLVIGPEYKYLSFGAPLINIAQLYSSLLIKKIDSSSKIPKLYLFLAEKKTLVITTRH